MLAAQTPAPFAAGKLPAGWTQGIDVSSLNHPNGAPIRWAEVAAAGYRFAFVKATEGSYYANPYYASDATAARKAGLFTAAYHFAIPNDSSAILQADLAVNAVGNLTTGGATLPLILDAEYDPYVSLDHTNYCYGLSQPTMVAWIQAFTAEVVRRTGEAPAIYTTADWWSLCTGNSTAFSADALWQASNGTPPAVPGWTGWTYWQHTSRAAVPGISGKTDADYFKATTLSAAAPQSRTDPAGANISLPIRSLAATAGTNITYAASGLPPSLSIDPATGVISGALPATPASYPVTVTLAGPASQAQVLPFTWNVRGPARLIRRPRQSSPGRQRDQPVAHRHRRAARLHPGVHRDRAAARPDDQPLRSDHGLGLAVRQLPAGRPRRGLGQAHPDLRDLELESCRLSGRHNRAGPPRSG